MDLILFIIAFIVTGWFPLLYGFYLALQGNYTLAIGSMFVSFLGFKQTYDTICFKEMLKEKKMSIEGFFKEYRFLSNFHLATVELDGVEYKSVEHAYQAAKTLDPSERDKVREAATPADAKKLGRKINVREDWENVKFSIMEELVRQKFNKHENLKEMLLQTGDSYLEETNNWHDCIWGVCNCENCRGQGENYLGKTLMKVREELKISHK